MNIYGMTDIGTCRHRNEDSFGYCPLMPPPLIKGRRGKPAFGMLAVVCDGMGGAQGGEVASRTATEIFMNAMQNCEKKDVESSMQSAIAKANRAVYEKAREDDALTGMGCTAAAAVAYDDTLALLHVGDSRIYLCHEGRLLLLTRDHSYVQQLVDAGKMSAEEARHSRYKNIITRAVGTAPRVEADFALCRWEEGDKLLLCTDGLTGFVEESEICAVLSENITVEDASRELIAAANARGCDDNLTALILENQKEKEHD